MEASQQETLLLGGVRRMEASRIGYGVSVSAVAASVLGCAASFLMAKSDNALGTAVGLLSMPFLFGLLSAWWFRTIGRKPSMRADVLRLTEDAILLGDERLVERDDIASAVVWPARNLGTIVRIARKALGRASIDVLVGSLGDGRALVRALRQSGAQTTRAFRIAAASHQQYRKRVASFFTAAPLMLLVMALAGGFIGKGTIFNGICALIALGYAGFVAQLLSSTRVEVGTDGIAVRWLWQKSFVPMSDVLRVERVEGDVSWTGNYPVIVRVHRRSGPPVDLLAQMPKRTAAGRDDKWAHVASREADMLIERITEAVQERATGGDADLASWESELLSRGERAIDQWVAALRGLSTEVESFRRQAGGGIDALWGVVEDAAAAPERRAAAAVALAPHLDEGGKERVRIAARATAAPKLRIALEAAATNDEDALAEALDEVAPPRRSTVARAD